MLSLALGASKVFAMGRNPTMLKFLAERDPRVVVLGQEEGQSNEEYLKIVKETIQTTADVVRSLALSLSLSLLSLSLSLSLCAPALLSFGTNENFISLLTHWAWLTPLIGQKQGSAPSNQREQQCLLEEWMPRLEYPIAF